MSARVDPIEKRQTRLDAPDKSAAADPPGWRTCTREMPDADLTVMIHHPKSDEPVWMGFYDGECWRSIDGARTHVSHWMPLPDGPSS